MRKWIGSLLWAITAVLMVAVISCKPANIKINSYAEDRAQIEDLQARYMFALDFKDPDVYVSTFTEDGILDIVGMKWEGRENIRKIFERTPPAPPEGEEISAAETPEVEEPAVEPSESEENPTAKEAEGPYPATGRHNITNIVIKIDGDNAVGRAYWFHYGNNNLERKATLDSYGHYEDEMVKVNGEWLFSKRVIYNEQMADWIGPTKNPCW